MFDNFIGGSGQNVQKLSGDNIESLLKLDNIIAIFFVYNFGHRVKVVSQRLKTKRIAIFYQFVFKRIVLKIANNVIRFFFN